MKIKTCLNVPPPTARTDKTLMEKKNRPQRLKFVPGSLPHQLVLQNLSTNSLEYLEQSRQILRRLLSATWPKYCNTLLSPQTYLETLEGNISKFLIYTRKNVETNTK